LDFSGRSVRKVENRKCSYGKNEIKFNVSELKTGIYLYKINVSNINGDFVQTKKRIKKRFSPSFTRPKIEN